MVRLKNRRVVAGIGAGISAYRTLDVIRLLRKAGASVAVSPTKNAMRFVSKNVLEVLSGQECIKAIKDGNICHIEEAYRADAIIIAPATSDLIAKMATGLADEILLQILLSFRGPVLIAPAMETNMWLHPATQQNVQTLRKFGYHFVGPEDGDLASGRDGLGRMSSPETIVENVESLLSPKDFADHEVLVTLGPTREAIDPVRFLSNHSSGKMGVALIRALAHRGAKVHAVLGPISEDLPKLDNIFAYKVTTAIDMHAECVRLMPQLTGAILCAAVGDFRPERFSDSKMKKNTISSSRIDLVQNPDILRTLGQPRERKSFLVGFAAESENLIENAQNKCREKQCDFICANSIAGSNSAFESEKNEITIVDKNRVIKTIPRMSKIETAHQILDCILERNQAS